MGLPKRNGWFVFACSKAAPAAKSGTKVEFVEKPVKTMPSEMFEGLCRSKGVSDMNNLFVRSSGDVPSSNHHRELGKGCHFRGRLNLECQILYQSSSFGAYLFRISMRRIANAESVVSEGIEASFQSRIDIRIIIIIVAEIPISALR